MITVRINEAERDMTDSVDEQWIQQQINGRRHDGQIVCVRVTVNEPGLNVALTTPTCGNTAGGGFRPPNAMEQEVIELWRQRGLMSSDFTGGNLIAFLKQLRRAAA